MFNNVFEKTGVYFFPAPHEVFASDIWRRLSAPSKAVYPFILAKVWEQKSGDTVMLSANEIRDGTGLKSTNSVTHAREELESKPFGLIFTERKKGGYIYQILNPLNRHPLGKIEDFNKLPAELIEEYFRHYTAQFDVFKNKDNPDVLHSGCPFHDSSKMREKTLVMNLSDGGYWRCHHKDCEGRKGKLIAFEMAFAERLGGKPISRTQAHSNVQRIVVKAQRKRMQAEADEIARAQALVGIVVEPEWGILEHEELPELKAKKLSIRPARK
jgi:hypothetical protein